jgi:hypothetical protein
MEYYGRQRFYTFTTPQVNAASHARGAVSFLLLAPWATIFRPERFVVWFKIQV